MSESHQPWLRNRPIVRVRKELYRQSTRPGAAAVVGQVYIGPKLERMEVQAVEASVDIHTEMMRRWSLDNGRTWTPLEPMEPFVARYAGQDWVQVGGARFHDPVSGVLIEAWLRQILVGERDDAQAIRDYPAGIMTRQISTCLRCECFTYYRLSRDLGRTWTQPRQLRYEPGPDFDPANPTNPAFMASNQAYFGNNFVRHSNGTIVFAVCSANAPGDPQNATRYCKLGALLFAGRWNQAKQDYEWTAGKRIEVPYSLSYEGLQEPAVAELRDGRVMVVWRSAAEGYTVGRKYVSVSRDGGMTLDGARPLGYDDGSLFYSPATIHHLVRHSVTGKLYWFGNISRVPPRGNWPRYPLIIAEVDEDRVAIKRDTITVIDDRTPEQSEYVEFSNFWLLENRETHDWEITLTAYGEDPAHVNNANCYRYVLTPQ